MAHRWYNKPSISEASELHNPSIGFVSCPASLNLDALQGRNELQQAVEELIFSGCEYIAITFENEITNTAQILEDDIKPLMKDTPLYATSTSSVAQPAIDFGHLSTSNTLCFWSNSFAGACTTNTKDPERKAPVTGFAVETLVGKIAILTGSWPTLPNETKANLLEQYLNDPAYDDRSMIVAGSMQCKYSVAENLAARTLFHKFHVNGTFSLFLTIADPQTCTVQDMQTKAPYSVIVEVACSVVQPARKKRAVLKARPHADLLGRSLRENTPLWDKFLENNVDMDGLDVLINYLIQKCFQELA